MGSHAYPVAARVSNDPGPVVGYRSAELAEKLGIGPLRFLFNSPRMHIWHHDASDEGGVSKNYGIVLSLWDWIFRTVHWPENREPERLGYPDDNEMPQTFGGQVLWPLTRLRALRFFHSSR